MHFLPSSAMSSLKNSKLQLAANSVCKHVWNCRHFSDLTW
uniref:Uncharacterized protein MANES_10G017600 n=1 Tax=Rhizophora mucronata TaxID=61149 RepID=A0A2P2IR60_RHIMU